MIFKFASLVLAALTLGACATRPHSGYYEPRRVVYTPAPDVIDDDDDMPMYNGYPRYAAPRNGQCRRDPYTGNYTRTVANGFGYVGC